MHTKAATDGIYDIFNAAPLFTLPPLLGATLGASTIDPSGLQSAGLRGAKAHRESRRWQLAVELEASVAAMERRTNGSMRSWWLCHEDGRPHHAV